MNRKLMFVAAFVAVLAALLVVGVALAKKPPCPNGWQAWWHELGNGRVECLCFKKDKPPRNPEFHKGCPVDNGDSDGDGGGSSTSTSEPGDTPESGNTPAPGDTPAPKDTPVPAGGGGSSNSDVATISRMSTYDPVTGNMTVWTVGGVGSFRLIRKSTKDVVWFEVPDDWVAVTLSEHRSTLHLGKLPPDTYWLFAHHWMSGNSGDDGEKFVVP